MEMNFRRCWFLYTLFMLLALVLGAEDVNKRAPSGFQGMRGKKNLLYESGIYDDYIKRAPVGFTGMRGKKYDELEGDSSSYYQSVSAAEVDKRVPAGFTGMRGKKLSEFNQDVNFMEFGEEFKRTPSGFMGMRGKKYDEIVGNELEKRTPSGFMGMRGKKESDMFYFPDRNEYLLKRAPFGFQGMRGKKRYGSFKRAPLGFTGMRGKKSMDDEFEDGVEYEKRAPTGFTGMRGKKTIFDYEDYSDVDKRTPNGFMGMRGKKQKSSAFFGLRGKKGPYDFIGKFVAVRGKKRDDEFGYNENWETNANGSGDLQRLLQSLDDSSVRDYDKRAGPLGFVGMRGKKLLDDGTSTQDGRQVNR